MISRHRLRSIVTQIFCKNILPGRVRARLGLMAVFRAASAIHSPSICKGSDGAFEAAGAVTSVSTQRADGESAVSFFSFPSYNEKVNIKGRAVC